LRSRAAGRFPFLLPSAVEAGWPPAALEEWLWRQLLHITVAPILGRSDTLLPIDNLTWCPIRQRNAALLAIFPCCTILSRRPNGAERWRSLLQAFERRSPGGMDETTRVLERVDPYQQRSRHYHVIENTVGNPQGYRDDMFRSRRRALEVARTRAHWLAAVGGSRVESLLGPVGRYLITTGRPHDPGRMIAVEECDDAECLELGNDSLVE
jgi:hypothetical protein